MLVLNFGEISALQYCTGNFFSGSVPDARIRLWGFFPAAHGQPQKGACIISMKYRQRKGANKSISGFLKPTFWQTVVLLVWHPPFSSFSSISGSDEQNLLFLWVECTVRIHLLSAGGGKTPFSKTTVSTTLTIAPVCENMLSMSAKCETPREIQKDSAFLGGSCW